MSNLYLRLTCVVLPLLALVFMGIKLELLLSDVESGALTIQEFIKMGFDLIGLQIFISVLAITSYSYLLHKN